MNNRLTRVMVGCVATLCVMGHAWAETTPDEIVAAVDKMTPEQAQELFHSVAKKMHENKGERRGSGLGLALSTAYASFDKVEVPFSTSAGEKLNIDEPWGAQLDITSRCRCERMRWGLRLAGWTPQDADISDAGYTRATLAAYEVSVLANVQLVRKPRFLVWGEAAGGRGSAALETLDTPAGEASTLRELTANYWVGDVRAGVAWRSRPGCAVFGTGGYRFANDTKWKEADRDTSARLDTSGFVASIGVAFNL